MLESKIVLINGKKRAGKDYFAHLLQEDLKTRGYTSEIMSFAWPIKEILSRTFNMSIEELEECKNNPDEYKIRVDIPNGRETPDVLTTDFREILQVFGTEAMKEQFGEEVWRDLLMRRANRSKCDFVIVPDFRFLSENVANITIKITNNDLQDNDQHRSENELNGFEFNYYVDNTGYRDLKGDVEYIASSLIEQKLSK